MGPVWSGGPRWTRGPFAGHGHAVRAARPAVGAPPAGAERTTPSCRLVPGPAGTSGGQEPQFAYSEIIERSPAAAVTWTHTPCASIRTGCVARPDRTIVVCGVPSSVRIPTSR